MPYSFLAVALDYDGTLTEGGPPSAHVLAALTRARAEGRKLVLVTGRILPELTSEFPDVHRYFDAVVAENGALLSLAGVVRPLAEPIDPELSAALIRRGVPARSGQVLLATTAIHANAVWAELGNLGLECQLVRNRGELMVLPPGISKGTGLLEALGELGVSHHSTLGVGDGENDHSLLEVCEVGAAVGNAIPALQAHADVVLSQRAGDGVASLLEGPLVRGEVQAQPRLWRVTLGTVGETEGGAAVELPASGINVLMAGGSGTGKSYLAGLLAERLVRMGYSTVVIDPEGDHTSLGRLRGMLVVGGGHPLPPACQLPELVRHRFGSLVVDLSHLPPPEQQTYSGATLQELQRQRAASGLPHWIIVDEAHDPVGVMGAGAQHFDPSQKGFCLVTYHPEELCEKALTGIDQFLFPLSGATTPRLESFLRLAGVDRPDPAWTRHDLGRGRALRVAGRGQPAELFRVGPRASQHVRHWHKYLSAQLPPRSRFVFRTGTGPTGVVASNVAEFHHDLLAAPDAVIAHHASRGDFACWAGQSLQDPVLADAMMLAEQHLREGPGAARVALLDAVERRYGNPGLEAAV